LLVRNDLRMGKGKIAAQCSHATLGCYQRALKMAPANVLRWSRSGQTKVAVKVEDEETMLALEAQARAAGLVTYIVADAGRTQIAAGSLTVLAIGPAPKHVLNDLVGHLKLL
ncbi:peptidyl-tRNA hydrolase, partial [Dimargaris cristalligena]